jgi:hypothetical protein
MHAPNTLPAAHAARDVLIALTDGQVEQVVREASGRQHPASLLPELGELDIVSELVLPLFADDSYSRSVLRALLVLNALPPDGSAREITDIARDVEISPSTTHRYMHTWMAVGLVEQHPRSRRYRRARVGDANAKQTTTGGPGAG